MKKLKISLLGKIVIAIIIGITVGMLSPEWMVRTFNTFNVTGDGAIAVIIDRIFKI